MKIQYIILFITLQFPIISISQCYLYSDSLALVSFYNATNGLDWFNTCIPGHPIQAFCKPNT